jgi:hypothetical protein
LYGVFKLRRCENKFKAIRPGTFSFNAGPKHLRTVTAFLTTEIKLKVENLVHAATVGYRGKYLTKKPGAQ